MWRRLIFEISNGYGSRLYDMDACLVICVMGWCDCKRDLIFQRHVIFKRDAESMRVSLSNWAIYITLNYDHDFNSFSKEYGFQRLTSPRPLGKH